MCVHLFENSTLKSQPWGNKPQKWQCEIIAACKTAYVMKLEAWILTVFHRAHLFRVSLKSCIAGVYTYERIVMVMVALTSQALQGNFGLPKLEVLSVWSEKYSCTHFLFQW